ncbi:hypothetical protein C8F04DRAFT_133919 [Mycena alexandri]|uniref:Sugar phosphate transporter domain-containing protein n=1 Tax=Mycena alexandri TaxID=1745969 RepID=A0AAD6SDP9_9AGAR|nr:hypothetical protein C8F04DRAFT_133919 [Mycena alexandri]
MHAREPEASQMEVAGVVIYYIVAALVMVFVNKAVLNNTPDLPFTFLFIQVFIAVVLLRLLAWANRTRLGRNLPVKFELPMFNRAVVVNLFPYLTVGITGLIFNTLCLANVDAAFFQIARGLLLPFTILVSSVANRVQPHPRVVFAAFVVTCGFLVGSAPSLYRGRYAGSLSHESALGLFCGCMSSFVLSVHAVLKKSALAHVGQSALALSYYGNLFMSAGLFPCLILHGELGVLRTRYYDVDAEWRTFVVGSLVTGFFGFLLGISHSLSIKVTSPITHMFSSAAKGVIQTILGMWIFSDILTSSHLYSISVITGGTVYYTWVQTSKPRARFPKSDPEKEPLVGERGISPVINEKA